MSKNKNKPTTTITVIQPSLWVSLFLLFVAARLFNHTDWEWYWVASPLIVKLALDAITEPLQRWVERTERE
jgi:hypothetical protein